MIAKAVVGDITFAHQLWKFIIPPCQHQRIKTWALLLYCDSNILVASRQDLVLSLLHSTFCEHYFSCYSWYSYKLPASGQPEVRFVLQRSKTQFYASTALYKEKAPSREAAVTVSFVCICHTSQFQGSQYATFTICRS